MKDLLFTVAELPPGMNSTMKMHWAVYREEKGRWVWLVRIGIGRNMWSYPGRVAIEYVRYSTQRMDKDNLYSSFKFIGDALKILEIIKNDSPKFVDEVRTIYRQERVGHLKEQRIEVRIMDLELLA